MERTNFTNKELLENQLNMLKTFLERGVISKEQYEYEVKVLTTKIEIDKK
ncbi:MAG: hypothetical protein MJ066_02565 [Clostridia bacterium]|nr:hypothetical protein [Clostridia bacterium]